LFLEVACHVGPHTAYADEAQVFGCESHDLNFGVKVCVS
jgi:hypothetical protein